MGEMEELKRQNASLQGQSQSLQQQGLLFAGASAAVLTPSSRRIAISRGRRDTLYLLHDILPDVT